MLQLRPKKTTPTHTKEGTGIHNLEDEGSGPSKLQSGDPEVGWA